MKRAALSIGTLVGVLLLTGCGGGSSDGTTDTTTTTGYDITVERGPVLRAIVLDKAGRQAQEIGDGKYRFAENPEYPVTAFGGFIDLNRDGTVNTGDINNSVILKAAAGEAATLVNTVATRAEIRAWLKESFGLSDETIDNATPSTDRTVAAISDEIYAYCIQKKVTDPATLTLQQMESIQDRIQNRIHSYLSTDAPTSDLENQLVEELNIPTLTQDQIQFNGYDKMPHNQIDTIANTLPESNLTDEQKYALAYMWNEEKLAKDIYLALNDLTPHQTLSNIATRSETQHEAAVEDLVQKYDINITNLKNYEIHYSEEELRALAPGRFAVPKIQELYDALYEKGSQSLQDALEVGCMVEVTDVNDLNEYIEIAGDSLDLITVFSFLRSGSYNHYWAFDRALKNMGVTDGCCSLGEAYCKTPEEYPSNNGQGQGNGKGNGQGNGYHGGR